MAGGRRTEKGRTAGRAGRAVRERPAFWMKGSGRPEGTRRPPRSPYLALLTVATLGGLTAAVPATVRLLSPAPALLIPTPALAGALQNRSGESYVTERTRRLVERAFPPFAGCSRRCGKSREPGRTSASSGLPSSGNSDHQEPEQTH